MNIILTAVVMVSILWPVSHPDTKNLKELVKKNNLKQKIKASTRVTDKSKSTISPGARGTFIERFMVTTCLTWLPWSVLFLKDRQQ